MRLIALFLLCSVAAAYWIDNFSQPAPRAEKLNWPSEVYVRQEGRNCPLYYPSDLLR